MNEFQEKAISAIEAQQKKAAEYSAQWMVGEQLKDICRREPHSAELIAQDLEVKEMGIAEAEKKIHALADSRKKGNSSCVSPMEADRILREFYGLPGQSETAGTVVGRGPMTSPGRAEENLIHLEDFF